MCIRDTKLCFFSFLQNLVFGYWISGPMYFLLFVTIKSLIAVKPEPDALRRNRLHERPNLLLLCLSDPLR